MPLHRLRTDLDTNGLLEYSSIESHLQVLIKSGYVRNSISFNGHLEMTVSGIRKLEHYKARGEPLPDEFEPQTTEGTVACMPGTFLTREAYVPPEDTTRTARPQSGDFLLVKSKMGTRYVEHRPAP